MQIRVDIPADQEQRVIAAFCTDRWTEKVVVQEPTGEQDDNDNDLYEDVEVKNPLTQKEFVNKLVGDYVNQVVADFERARAMEEAQATPDPVVTPVE